MNSFTAPAANVIPDPTPTIPDQAAGALTLLNWASGIGLLLGVLGVILVGSKLVVQLSRGDGGQHIAALGWVLTGCILISSASGIVRAFV